MGFNISGKALDKDLALALPDNTLIITILLRSSLDLMIASVIGNEILSVALGRS